MKPKPTIQPNQVLQVYSGRPGCACGCRGNYSETERAKKMMITKLNRTTTEIKSVEGICGDGTIYYWDNEEGTRTYSIILKKGA